MSIRNNCRQPQSTYELRIPLFGLERLDQLRLGHALCVYVALCRLAQMQRNWTITTTAEELAVKSYTSRRNVFRCIKLLAQEGLIESKRCWRGLRMRIEGASSAIPRGQVAPAVPLARSTLSLVGTTDAALPGTPTSVCDNAPSIEEVRSYAKTIDFPESMAGDWWNEMVTCNWRDYANRPIHNWRTALQRKRDFWVNKGKPMVQPKNEVKSAREVEARIRVLRDRVDTLSEDLRFMPDGPRRIATCDEISAAEAEIVKAQKSLIPRQQHPSS